MNTDTAQLGSLTQRLETVATNLHGYLEERARELAEPYIAVAEKLANRRIAEAEAEAQRERDLVAELRRQLAAQERRANRAEHERGKTHNAGYCEQCDAARRDAKPARQWAVQHPEVDTTPHDSRGAALFTLAQLPGGVLVTRRSDQTEWTPAEGAGGDRVRWANSKGWFEARLIDQLNPREGARPAKWTAQVTSLGTYYTDPAQLGVEMRLSEADFTIIA